MIGWSLGGLFVREVAKKHPEYVRAVITLGSPLSGNTDHTWASWVYEKVNGPTTDEMREYFGTLPENPPMPTTSIYSKADGIVAWRNSILDEEPMSENIRVSASHSGLGSNPQVLKIIAGRLAQSEKNWARFVNTQAASSVQAPIRKKS